MNINNNLAQYEARKNELLANIAQIDGQIKIKKNTSSNLFRYQPRKNADRHAISLQDFCHVLHIDATNKTLEVEGLTTYETIVNFTLSHGLLPTVAPELKFITVGGAIVGIGIESTCFKYGFVHDGLIEADVLLPDGRIVICSPDNEHADLFHALPNSYGTLGYILKAKIKLHAAKQYVHLTNQYFDNIDDYLAAMKQAALTGDQDFIEGLFYNSKKCILTSGYFVAQAPQVLNIYQEIYYKALSDNTELYLKTNDYIFRFDPDWFWNIPETSFYNFYRRYAPRAWRNSGFYKRYTQRKNRLMNILGVKREQNDEPLIQDWEVKWDHGKELMQFVLEHVDLEGRPWVALPIKPLSSPTSYPVTSGELYFNLGCYCYVKKAQDKEAYHYTKMIDNKCFALGGIKMLYSSTFLNKEEFDRIFNGAQYEAVKSKYDTHKLAPSLFEKAVQAS